CMPRWDRVPVEGEQMTTSVAKCEALLRNEYEAAASKGRAVYGPDRFMTPGTDVLNFLGNARISFSEVHIGPLVIPSRKDGEESPAQARGGSLVSLGMTIHAPQVDRYQNRLSEFAADVKKKKGRRQIFFTATKGGGEKIERLS